MSAVTVNTPYPTFTDIDGQPLEDGYVWIGVSGLEPQANPQAAYWDAALTQVVTQPVRTRGGYPLNGTAIGRLYTAAPYSIKVQNKNSSTIVLDLTGAAGTGVGSISFGTTGLTPAVATDGDVVVAGTLAVANGGTGQTTFTNGQLLIGNTTGNTLTKATLTAGTGVTITNGTGSITIAAAGLPTMNVVAGTSQAAVAGNHYVLTNVAATTVTLPSTPVAGDVVWVTVGNGLTTNVVARNGNRIQGLTEDLTLNATYAAVQMRYINATIGWTFV